MSTKDLVPEFHHSEIQSLYANGWDFPESKIKTILALPRQTLITDLEKVIEDSIVHFADYEAIDWAENTHTFPIHAIWLLCELKAEESLPKVLDVLRQEDDYLMYWFNDLIHEMLPLNYWQLGINRTDVLFDFLREPSDEWGPRAVISTAILHIALYNEDKKAEIIEGYKNLIEYILIHKDNPKIANQDFIGGFLMDIFDLRSLEMMPHIKQLYDADLVLQGMVGSWTEYQRDFNDSTLDRESYFHSQNMAEHYAEMRQILAKNAANKMKNEIEAEKRKLSGLFKKPHKSQVQPTMDLKKLMQNKSTPRNAPCPCGSGRKFKNCHGK